MDAAQDPIRLLCEALRRRRIMFRGLRAEVVDSDDLGKQGRWTHLEWRYRTAKLLYDEIEFVKVRTGHG